MASPDLSQPFVIHCDASDHGVGAVLYQTFDGIERPIAYASKQLNSCQRKYGTTEKELLAVRFAVEKVRTYVEGTRFTVVTDHASLKWLYKLSNPSGSLARWAMYLSQYDFDIKHRKGTLNVVADALSRTEVAVLDLQNLRTNKWYDSMVENVQRNPELYPYFRKENNIFYKHIFNKYNIGSNQSDWKIVIPASHRKQILDTYHDHETAAHLGISKILSRTLELYYWPNLRKDVQKYVMGNYKSINFPFQLVSADLLGPYPRFTNGNQYLLVLVDWFTKFCLVHPMPKATTKNIVKFLENHVFSECRKYSSVIMELNFKAPNLKTF